MKIKTKTDKAYLKMLSIIILSLCSTGKNITNATTMASFTNFQYGNSIMQQINISIPDIPEKELCAILFIHGANGGKMEYWTFLDFYIPDYIVGIMNYENKDRNMDELMYDVDHAIMVIDNQAFEKDITVKKIIIIGHSFGGAIALNYCYRDFKEKNRIPVAFCVGLSAFSDMVDPNIPKVAIRKNPLIKQSEGFTNALYSFLYSVAGTVKTFMESLKNISPVYRINENSPPTIIVHDQDDKVIPYSNSETLQRELNAKNVPNIFIPTNNLGHSLGARKKSDVKTIDQILETKLIDAINNYINLYMN
jgi:predicted esterase